MSYNPTKLFGFINPLSRHVFSCFPFILMGINYINHHKPNQQRLQNLRPSLCAVLRKDLFAILVGAVNGQPRPRCELCHRRGRGHLTHKTWSQHKQIWGKMWKIWTSPNDSNWWMWLFMLKLSKTTVMDGANKVSFTCKFYLGWLSE